MSAPGKLVRSSRWKTGPSKGQRPLGSECCATAGVQVIGTRWWTDFHSISLQLRALYIRTTASTLVRTPMLPEGSPPQVHEHEKDRPASSFRSRCHRRTSIEK